MKRSHGFNSKHSRNVLAGVKKTTITQLLRTFVVGDIVRIKCYARANGGKFPLRYNGRLGKVVGQQGKSYIVEFPDLNAVKRLVLANVHLQKI